MTLHEMYMRRCLQLAALALGQVAPNPIVGAVLENNGRVIGEGYHQTYGKAHAEVMCLASVHKADRQLIPESTLYVSLEPCAHFGKTPPCADLVIEQKIKHVVIGCRDPFEEVNGKGIERLRAAGINVEVGVLEKECKIANKRFFLYHTRHRPYIVLKWAQTGDGKIAAAGDRRLLISNAATNRVVHKWRSEEAAIVVGTNTALIDNPHLTTRYWPGKNPIRVVIDVTLRLPPSLHLFTDGIPTLVFNLYQHSLPLEKISMHALREMGVVYYRLSSSVSVLHQVLNGLHQLGIQSILVEGGAQLLQSFINEGLWDEARVITNGQLVIGEGVAAPQLTNGKVVGTEAFGEDTLQWIQPFPL